MKTRTQRGLVDNGFIDRLPATLVRQIGSQLDTGTPWERTAHDTVFAAPHGANLAAAALTGVEPLPMATFEAFAARLLDESPWRLDPESEEFPLTKLLDSLADDDFDKALPLMPPQVDRLPGPATRIELAGHLLEWYGDVADPAAFLRAITEIALRPPIDRFTPATGIDCVTCRGTSSSRSRKSACPMTR